MCGGEEKHVSGPFSFDVEVHIDDEVGLRRYRWRLKGAEGERPSSETFATKREATKAGEVALQRARERDRISP
jgi:hypothetical protein